MQIKAGARPEAFVNCRLAQGSCFGLAMCSSGPKGQTQPPQAAQGRADLRAAERSADDRREAEAPKAINLMQQDKKRAPSKEELESAS
ncbi:hypothetical protein SGRA_1903 [Saprospira grandis str. Lewin]|uniref:Uncharacterized protein n=1 Tax=Saprospira grandis (strain Lewin) TaxID=984262 RepID=H6L1J3_SAPGL|nr:hypothetical protein SGRA_1903 [Saprospira grandis str. Lewin]